MDDDPRKDAFVAGMKWGRDCASGEVDELRAALTGLLSFIDDATQHEFENARRYQPYIAAQEALARNSANPPSNDGGAA
jgi:hypothetical protein